MAYDNLPGVFTEKQDGQLAVLAANLAPKILLIGTSEKGVAEVPYSVGRTQEAAVLFGRGGTLTRGMYESKTAGGENVILFRVGATPATLTGIGATVPTAGISITTGVKDDTAAVDYEMFWNNATHKLQVWNVETGALVFERDFDDPLPTTDLGELSVEGTYVPAAGVDIGSALAHLTLRAANVAHPATTQLVEGTDGTSPSRMEMYENLFKAYKLLENQVFDLVVPLDTYLNDLNVADMTAPQILALTYTAGAFPAPSTSNDALLYFYTEEFEGEWYFWWRKKQAALAASIAEESTISCPSFAAATSGDYIVLEDQAGLRWAIALDKTGAAPAPTGAVWTAIPAGRKAQVDISADVTNIDVCISVVAAFGLLAGIAAAMTITDNLDGTFQVLQVTAGDCDPCVPFNLDDTGAGSFTATVITEGENAHVPDVYPTGYATVSPNGNALAALDFHEVNFAYQLANFCYSVSTNVSDCHGVIGVKPPQSISLRDVSIWIGVAPTYSLNSLNEEVIAGPAQNGTGLLGNKFMAGKYGFRNSAAYGGFVATETGYLDGTELEDRGGHIVDIGAYISVVGAWVQLFNSFDTSGLGYISTFTSAYAGDISARDAKSAPTNKVVESIGLPFRIGNAKLDALVGMRYVFCQEKAKGTVIVDAPTAARPDSDYRRLTTVRIVKQTLDAVRLAADPFIGEAGTASQRAALKTAIENKLSALMKGGYLSRFDLSVTATPAQMVVGDATVELVVVPAFELRQITVVFSLAML